MRKTGGLLLLLLLCCGLSWGQPPSKNYTIRNGRMWIELSKNLSESSLDSFIVQFDLAELGIKTFIRTGVRDSLQKLGWQLDKNTPDYFVISKVLEGFDKIGNPAEKILLQKRKMKKDYWLPLVPHRYRLASTSSGINQISEQATPSSPFS